MARKPPSRRPQFDDYGKPLPHLATPQPQPASLVTSAENEAMLTYVLHTVTQSYAVLFCRGCYADVTLTLHVKDGTIQREVDVSVVRHHRREDT